MPTYLEFTEAEYLGFTEAEYIPFAEGSYTTQLGYFDSFSMIFGWWHAEPAFYRYKNMGIFYIARSHTKTYYIARSHTKTYYIGSHDL